MITCAVENAEHYRIQLAEIGELHDPQPSRQGQTTISCSISKCLGTKRQESLHGRLRVLGLLRDKHISLGDAGRPSKLTSALEKTILLAIAEDGCTYVDACLIAGICNSTFHKWKLQGQAARSGLFREFVDKLKKAEADFRAHHLKKIQDAAR